MRSGARPNASRAKVSASVSLPSCLGGAAALDQQQGAQGAAAVGGHHLLAHAGLERLLRRLPLAGLRLHVEQRMHDPRRLRPEREGALGIVERLLLVAVAQRLGDQPAQAEEGHLVVLEHRLEGAVGAVAIAVELRGLRRQQQRERRLGQQLLGARGMALRLDAVACRDGGEALRQLAIALAAGGCRPSLRAARPARR